MNFLRKLFGQKSPAPSPAPGTPAHASASVPAADSSSQGPAPSPRPPEDSIRVHDAYGREIQISKTDWRTKVLPEQLAKIRAQPDQLAALVAQSLRDGFAAEVLDSAAHLAATDGNAERGHVLHAAALLALDKPAEAEAVLRAFLEKRGETGLALSNLAKARAAQSDQDGALDLLWRALSLDPNQDQALAWFAAHHREKSGDAGALDAFRRVAGLPDSWRARLWLARDRLAQRDLTAALKLYDEVLDRAPRPVPADLLQQMSGDLGNHAHLPELLQLAAPYYDVAKHGLPSGLNILKAYHDLGQLDAARRFLDRLYAAQRPDWKQALAFWDAEIAKSRLAVDATPPAAPRPVTGASSPLGTPSPASASAPSQTSAPRPPSPAKLEVTLLAVEGPVWLPPDSPAAELFAAKADDAPLVAFLGASAEVEPPSGQPGQPRLADGPGRLSRALPLYLAEQTELSTPALARTLVPWLVKPRPGFILGGVPWDDATASRHARAVVPDDAADYLVVTHLRCVAEPWTIELRLVRTIDAACLATASVACPPSDPGQALPLLTSTLHELLSTHADIACAVQAPGSSLSAPGSDYLLRLEQLLAVRTAGIEPTRSPLNGEREILDGQLRLCLEHPENLPVRLVFAHTLKSMKRVRPDILPEFQGRAELLQKEKPLPEPAQSVVSRLLAETFAD